MKKLSGSKGQKLQAALFQFIKHALIGNQSGDDTHRHGSVNTVHRNSVTKKRRGEVRRGEKREREKRGRERREKTGKERKKWVRGVE